MAIEIANATIRLSDLALRSTVIDDLHATDVTFIGPSIIAFVDSYRIEDCSVSSRDFDALIWEIDTHRAAVTGAVGLRRAQLVRCRFVEIGFAMRGPDLARFTEMFRVKGD